MWVFVIVTVSAKAPQNSYTQFTAAAWIDIFKAIDGFHSISSLGGHYITTLPVEGGVWHKVLKPVETLMLASYHFSCQHGSEIATSL